MLVPMHVARKLTSKKYRTVYVVLRHSTKAYCNNVSNAYVKGQGGKIVQHKSRSSAEHAAECLARFTDQYTSLEVIEWKLPV